MLAARALPLLVLQCDPLDQHIPQVLVQEVPVAVRMQPRVPHLLEQVVLFKPGPQHREIIDLIEGSDMEPPGPLLGWDVLEVVDHLALPRPGPGDEKQDVKRAVLAHAISLLANVARQLHSISEDRAANEVARRPELFLSSDIRHRTLRRGSGYHAGMPTRSRLVARISAPIRAVARTAVFFLKVFPMLPSRPIDWLTKPPQIVKVQYPTKRGLVEGDLYRPPTDGPHPGIVVCLGVVPFGVEHPQVAVLGRALARSGFAALLYWSPAMRDFRLDPEDIESIALAYKWLTDQPFIDASRSGLLGTCVGGSFGLMAAASPLIRDRVAFVSAYAPFSSMQTFARDIASASRTDGDRREPWRVDQLTRTGLRPCIDRPTGPRRGRRAAGCVRGRRGFHGRFPPVSGGAICPCTADHTHPR